MQNFERFAEAINHIRTHVKSDITAMQLSVFLDVAIRHPEGQPYADISHRTGVNEGAVGKYCKMLGDQFVKKGKDMRNIGHQLLRVDRNPLNTRQLVVGLSKKGLTLVKELDRIVGGK